MFQRYMVSSAGRDDETNFDGGFTVPSRRHRQLPSRQHVVISLDSNPIPNSAGALHK